MFPITDLIQPYFHEWIAKYRSKIIKTCKWYTSIWALIFWEQRGFPWCMNWSKLSRWGMIYYFHNASCMIFVLDSMIGDYYFETRSSHWKKDSNEIIFWCFFSFFKLIWPLVKIILWPLNTGQYYIISTPPDFREPFCTIKVIQWTLLHDPTQKGSWKHLLQLIHSKDWDFAMLTNTYSLPHRRS